MSIDQKHNSTLLHSNSENNKSKTFNKIESDAPVQLRQITELNQMTNNNQNNGTMHNNNGNSSFIDYRRHLEDVTNQQEQQHLQHQQHSNGSGRHLEPKENKALVIGSEMLNLDPVNIQINQLVRSLLTSPLIFTDFS